MEDLDPALWRERCAARFVALDANLSPGDVRDLARDAWSFERTRAMAPEDAADFVSREMTRPDRARFERRAAPR